MSIGLSVLESHDCERDSPHSCAIVAEPHLGVCLKLNTRQLLCRPVWRFLTWPLSA